MSLCSFHFLIIHRAFLCLLYMTYHTFLSMNHYSLILYWECHLQYLGPYISLSCCFSDPAWRCYSLPSLLSAPVPSTCIMANSSLCHCLRMHCNHMVFVASFCIIIAICSIPLYINYGLLVGHIDLLLNHCYLLLHNGCQLMLQGFLIMHLIKSSNSRSDSLSYAVVNCECTRGSSFVSIPLAPGPKPFFSSLLWWSNCLS